MKFRVKAVIPEGQVPLEAGDILLPPVKVVSYAWIYITALAAAIVGFIISRFRKRSKHRSK